jgi:hypothetical protein
MQHAQRIAVIVERRGQHDLSRRDDVPTTASDNRRVGTDFRTVTADREGAVFF